MPSNYNPALIVARFLKANHYDNVGTRLCSLSHDFLFLRSIDHSNLALLFHIS